MEAESAIKDLKDESQHKMEGAMRALEDEFRTLRTGRASAGTLDGVMVDAYGSEMPLNQVANITTPDARSILITPWDKSQVGAIERAIIAANLGYNPNNDGSNIRINVPPLTEERRKELVKLGHKMAEEARIAIRHVRKHAKDEIKKLEKDGVLTEDFAHDAQDLIQKVTDDFIKKVDDRMKKKEDEMMAV